MRSARVIQRFVAAATVVGRVSIRTLLWLAVTLLGRWQWQRPAWVSFTAGRLRQGWRYLRAKPVRGVGLIAVIVAMTADYRRKVRAAYAQLPPDSREQFEHSVYGAVDDFDRYFRSFVESANGKALAFIVTYRATRLDDFPPMQTVVRCQHQSNTWTCEESSVEQASRATEVTVSRGGNGLYETAVLERVLRALVER